MLILEYNCFPKNHGTEVKQQYNNADFNTLHAV